MKKFNKFQMMTSWFDSEMENSDFDFQTVCMCAMFTRVAREMGVSIAGGAGINIEYGPDKRSSHVYGPTPFYTLESRKDIRCFFDMNARERKVFSVALMKEGVGVVADYIRDDRSKFDPVFYEIIKSDYVNRFLWRRKKAKGRPGYFEVYVRYEVESIFVELEELIGSEAGVSHRTIFRIDPNEYMLNQMLGNLVFSESGDLLIVPKTPGLPEIKVPVS